MEFHISIAFLLLILYDTTRTQGFISTKYAEWGKDNPGKFLILFLCSPLICAVSEYLILLPWLGFSYQVLVVDGFHGPSLSFDAICCVQMFLNRFNSVFVVNFPEVKTDGRR